MTVIKETKVRVRLNESELLMLLASMAITKSSFKRSKDPGVVYQVKAINHIYRRLETSLRRLYRNKAKEEAKNAERVVTGKAE